MSDMKKPKPSPMGRRPLLGYGETLVQISATITEDQRKWVMSNTRKLGVTTGEWFRGIIERERSK